MPPLTAFLAGIACGAFGLALFVAVVFVVMCWMAKPIMERPE